MHAYVLEVVRGGRSSSSTLSNTTTEPGWSAFKNFSNTTAKSPLDET